VPVLVQMNLLFSIGMVMASAFVKVKIFALMKFLLMMKKNLAVVVILDFMKNINFP